MNARRVAIAAVLTALLTIVLVWLSGEGPLARVTSTEGKVERDTREAQTSWQAAREGDAMNMGDAVRTGSDSQARLTLSGGTVLDVAQRTVLRLLSDAPEAQRFRVETGSAEVTAGDEELSFETAAGQVRVARGGRVTVRASAAETWVRVDLGRAELGWDENERSLVAGQEARAHVATADKDESVLPGAQAGAGGEALAAEEPMPSDAGAAEEPTPPAPEVAVEARSEVGLGVEGGAAPGAPTARDVLLVLGMSTTIHDPRPPTAVALGVGDACQGQRAVLEQQRGGRYQEKATDTDELLAWFPAGATSYRVRCARASGGLSKPVATGRIHVMRDSALRRVTKRAPELGLDLDGRKYTAVYQTLLPTVRVVLPGARGPATLRIESPSGSRTLALPAEGLTLRTGELSEGRHSLRATPAAGGVESPATTLVIQYDNTAPAAYLEGDSGGLVRSPDGSVVLHGGAVEGSKLSIDGTQVELDRAARFEARTTPQPGAQSVTLWIQHPRLGSHHYVRRLSGGAP